MNRLYILILFLVILFSCNKESIDPKDDEFIDELTSPNILLVIADDMGLDACPGYDIGEVKPYMPNLEAMINSGIRFTNVWSNPTCAPTRSTMITGKYGFRTGVTKVGNYLPANEKLLQTYISEQINNAYAQAVIGKWHLGKEDSHPNDMGLEYYAGFKKGALTDYWNWDLTINGETSICTDYNTTKYTDLAIEWVQQQTKPWFLWLAYNAPHDPYHLPDSHLHYQGSLPTDEVSINANPQPYYMATLEALDTEMGRLIGSLRDDVLENTLIIFIGDNGTPGPVAQVYNSRRVKGTVYQGGVNVPMIVSGKGVGRQKGIETALINCTDLFATIADVAGGNAAVVNDSKSFKAMFNQEGVVIRDYVYTELLFDDGGLDQAIRNNNYKLLIRDGVVEALYHLTENYFEKPNLLADTQSDLTAEAETNLSELNQAFESLVNQ